MRSRQLGAMALIVAALGGCGSSVYDDSAPIVQDMAWRYCAKTFTTAELPEPDETGYNMASWKMCLDQVAWDINHEDTPVTTTRPRTTTTRPRATTTTRPRVTTTTQFQLTQAEINFLADTEKWARENGWTGWYRDALDLQKLSLGLQLCDSFDQGDDFETMHHRLDNLDGNEVGDTDFIYLAVWHICPEFLPLLGD